MIAMATSQSGEAEQFAFGTEKTDDGCGCPAVAAGFDPSSDDPKPGLMCVVSVYDGQLNTEEPNGTVPEDQAREAWMNAIERWRKRDHERVVEVGEEVADELGWLDD